MTTTNFKATQLILVPADVTKACQKLGWTILGQDSYGGQSSYLVRDDNFITEPYTARAILDAARALDEEQEPILLQRQPAST